MYNPNAPRLAPTVRAAFEGALILNGGYTADVAEATLQRGLADAIGFGTLFLANPDLQVRFAKNAPLNVPDPTRVQFAWRPARSHSRRLLNGVARH